MTILSLCNGSGAWEKPYRDAGYNIIGVDPANGTGTVLRYAQSLVRLDHRPTVHGVLMAPPCTEFAGSGARWWADKDPQLLSDAIRLVYTCLAIKDMVQPVWWALENPVGRLPRFIGKWDYTWNPCDFGDPWTKRTCMWGLHRKPVMNPVEPTEGSKHWRLPPSADRAALRSETPPGFAQAFFEANP